MTAAYTSPDHFWAKVDKTSECWEWTGARRPRGYGVFRKTSAHRVAWTLTHGEIPVGLFVCHHCDNPPCVRPDHLFLGTHQDNVDDMCAKGRNRRPHCKRGHPYDAENARIRRDGTRICRTCERLRALPVLRPGTCQDCGGPTARTNKPVLRCWDCYNAFRRAA